MSSVIRLKDRAGYEHEFELSELYEQLKAGNFTLFGLSMPAILALRKYYQIYNGPDPATPESVGKIFENLQWIPEQDRFEYRMAEQERVKGRNLMRCPFRRVAS